MEKIKGIDFYCPDCGNPWRMFDFPIMQGENLEFITGCCGESIFVLGDMEEPPLEQKKMLVIDRETLNLVWARVLKGAKLN
jgi:hypothetical protein